MLSRVTHMTILSVVTCVMNVWNQTGKTFVTSFLSIWWLIEQACLPTRECQVHQFVPSRSMSRQFASILLTTLQPIQVPRSWNVDHPRKDFETLYCCSVFFVRQITISLNAFLSMLFHVVGPRSRFFAWGFSHRDNLSVAPAEIRDSYTLLLCNNFVRLAFSLSASQIQVIKKWHWFVKINIFHQFLPHGEPHSVSFSSHFHVVHVFRWE